MSHTCAHCGRTVKKPGAKYCRGCIQKGPAAERRSRFVAPPPVAGAAWIPLASGQFALVDEDLAPELGRYFWYFHKGYAYANVGRKRIALHQMVLPNVPQVDHKNRNRLDCRRDNLRRATQQQNLWNAARKRNSRSPYKGVTWDKSRGEWRAAIRIRGRMTFLGAFDNPEDAARAYDAAAREAFGEFAAVNFPESGETGAIQ